MGGPPPTGWSEDSQALPHPTALPAKGPLRHPQRGAGCGPGGGCDPLPASAVPAVKQVSDGFRLRGRCSSAHKWGSRVPAGKGLRQSRPSGRKKKTRPPLQPPHPLRDPSSGPQFVNGETEAPSEEPGPEGGDDALSQGRERREQSARWGTGRDEGTEEGRAGLQGAGREAPGTGGEGPGEGAGPRGSGGLVPGLELGMGWGAPAFPGLPACLRSRAASGGAPPPRSPPAPLSAPLLPAAAIGF